MSQKNKLKAQRTGGPSPSSNKAKGGKAAPLILTAPKTKAPLSGTFSPESVKWFINSTDPFHDTEVQGGRMPDGLIGRKSYVQQYRKEATISAPSTLGDGALWDANVFISSLTCPISAKRAKTFWNTNGATEDVSPLSELTSDATVADALIGGIEVFRNGANLGVNEIGGGSLYSATAYSPFGAPEQVNNPPGQYRVVSVGFEVRNVTAALTAQGAVQYYRMPKSETELSVLGIKNANDANPIDIPAYSVLSLEQPPGTVDDAALLYDTVLEKATEGALVVAFLDPSLNQPTRTEYQEVLRMNLEEADSPSGVNSVVACPLRFASTEEDYQVAFAAMTGQGRWMHHNAAVPAGALFSGLSKTTTLALSMRWIIEYFPARHEDTFTLASLTPAEDKRIMEAYEAAMRRLPPGVKVSENSAGDWFRRVMNGARRGLEFASGAGQLVGQFGIPGVSDVAGRLGDAAQVGVDLMDFGNARVRNRGRQGRTGF